MGFQITNDEARTLLYDRLGYWTKDEDVKELYMKMYDRFLEDGIFEENSYTIMEIVDNDWVNYCDFVSEDNEDFGKLVVLYKAGEYDVSCEDLECSVSFIEAVDNEDEPTIILVRY